MRTPDPAPPASVLAERSRVLALLKVYGWNATSFQVLEAGYRYFFSGNDACVAYVDTGRCWVAAGAPIAAQSALRSTAEAFIAAAKMAGRRACFFATEARFGELTALPAQCIGEQPVWDPVKWPETLRNHRSLREQLRRARKKGVVVRAVSPEELQDPQAPMRQAIESLAKRWLGARQMAPMGFLVQLSLYSDAGERRCLVAEVGGRVCGVLGMIPVYARGGWFCEDLLRAPDAPNGTMELLIDAAMCLAAESGSRYLTLGLAPLSGSLPGPLRAARKWGGALYDFAGLRAFKAKLRPQTWVPIYLSHPPFASAPLVFIDVLTAFARGGLIRFGLETLLRGPAVVVRILAALLLPWTLLLALAPAHCFPAPHQIFDLAPIAIAVAGPALSAFLLWRCRLHR